jgi:Arc/MetJ-type ribon-helix-helix transcriptional regulator
MYFEERIVARVSSETLVEMEKLIDQNNGERYDNLSHFVRCAIQRLIRLEKDGHTI